MAVRVMKMAGNLLSSWACQPIQLHNSRGRSETDPRTSEIRTSGYPLFSLPHPSFRFVFPPALSNSPLPFPSNRESALPRSFSFLYIYLYIYIVVRGSLSKSCNLIRDRVYNRYIGLLDKFGKRFFEFWWE